MSKFESGIKLPNAAGRWFRIVYPTPDHPLLFIALGEGWVGYWLHFDAASSLCTGQDCNGCRANLPTRWVGYLAALQWPAKDPVVVQLSEGAARQLVAAAERQNQLRGLKIELKRSKKRRNSPVCVVVHDTVGVERLPPAFDVRPSVERLFGVKGHSKPITGKDVQAWSKANVPSS